MWAQHVIDYSCATVIAKFKKGEAGAISYDLEQRKQMGRLIVRFCRSGYSSKWEQQFGITKEMYQARVITDRYLQIYCRSLACFRKDHNPVYAYRNTLQGFVEAGNLQKVEMHRIKNSGRMGTAYYITDINGLGK
jgi:hypothetical protein